eukprot:14569069-Ditylum_brightwellii.AAC.1
MAEDQEINATAPNKYPTSDTEENTPDCEAEEPAIPDPASKATKFLATTLIVDQKTQATELYVFVPKTS